MRLMKVPVLNVIGGTQTYIFVGHIYLDVDVGCTGECAVQCGTDVSVVLSIH